MVFYHYNVNNKELLACSFWKKIIYRINRIYLHITSIGTLLHYNYNVCSSLSLNNRVEISGINRPTNNLEVEDENYYSVMFFCPEKHCSLGGLCFINGTTIFTLIHFVKKTCYIIEYLNIISNRNWRFVFLYIYFTEVFPCKRTLFKLSLNE